MRRTQRGFTLIEAVIAVALLLGVIGISLKWMATAQKDTQRTALVNQEAMEIAKLTTATQSYLKTTEGLSETEGEIFAIAPADLVTAGFLPSDFAKRPASGSNDPVSPMGQIYSITAALTADGYRALVVPTGTPNAGFLARAGVANTPQAIQEFSVSVMEKLRQGYNVTASVITKDTKAVDAAASGFSYDLTTFLSAAPTVPTVVGMANFKELDPVVGGSDNGSKAETRTCNVSVGQSCPSGTTEEWKYTTCETWGPDHPEPPYVTTATTPAGTIVIKKHSNSITPGPPAPYGTTVPFGNPNGAVNIADWVVTLVGNANWVNSGATGATSTQASKCGAPRTFYEYRLSCPTSGVTTTSDYEPVCGEWHWDQPGTSCTAGGYMFSGDAMYQGGLTDNTRALRAVGVGRPIVSADYSYNGIAYVTTNFDSDPVVRTLSPCAGSVNAVPIKVHKKDLGGGASFEYIEDRSGLWRETITYGGSSDTGSNVVITANCSASSITTGNFSFPGATASGRANCPVRSYNRADGGTTSQYGLDQIRLTFPDSESHKVVRMCCT